MTGRVDGAGVGGVPASSFVPRVSALDSGLGSLGLSGVVQKPLNHSGKPSGEWVFVLLPSSSLVDDVFAELGGDGGEGDSGLLESKPMACGPRRRSGPARKRRRPASRAAAGSSGTNGNWTLGSRNWRRQGPNP